MRAKNSNDSTPHVLREGALAWLSQLTTLNDDDQMIGTLSPNRADDAFRVWILERRSRRGDHFFNLHPLYSQSKFCPVNLISIPEQIARRRVFREGFDELSGRPFSRRMRCNIEVDDLASVM